MELKDRVTMLEKKVELLNSENRELVKLIGITKETINEILSLIKSMSKKTDLGNYCRLN